MLKHMVKWNYVARCCSNSTLLNMSNWKFVKITFDSNINTVYVSLKVLIDNFGYFQNKNNLEVITNNGNYINLHFVKREIFEIILQIIAEGQLKIILYIYIQNCIYLSIFGMYINIVNVKFLEILLTKLNEEKFILYFEFL